MPNNKKTPETHWFRCIGKSNYGHVFSQGQGTVPQLKWQKPFFFEGMYYDNKGRISMRALRSVLEGQEISCLISSVQKIITHSKQREHEMRGNH